LRLLQPQTNDVAGSTRVLEGIAKSAQTSMMADGPWMCCICRGVATRMINTPAFHPNGPDGPVVLDYTPFPICYDPECNAEATRQAHSLTSMLGQGMQQNNTNILSKEFAEAEIHKCANCGVAKKGADGADIMNKTCSGCGAKAYCSRDCQKEHWKKGHKHTCARLDKK
jgi:hypothetical protein